MIEKNRDKIADDEPPEKKKKPVLIDPKKTSQIMVKGGTFQGYLSTINISVCLYIQLRY